MYPHQTRKLSLFLTIRPRFVGRAARPRAATLPIIAVHNYASGKAGGRCAPRLVTAVLGLTARGRPAAPDGRAERSLRQSGGENTGRKPHAMNSALGYSSRHNSPSSAGTFNATRAPPPRASATDVAPSEADIRLQRKIGRCGPTSKVHSLGRTEQRTTSGALQLSHQAPIAKVIAVSGTPARQ